MQREEMPRFVGTPFHWIAIAALVGMAGCGQVDDPRQFVSLNIGRAAISDEQVIDGTNGPIATRSVRLRERPADANETYSMALDLMLLVEANQGGRHDGLIDRLVSFLKAAQWNESNGLDRPDAFYGGTGASASSTPDLFHTAIVIEALHEAGVSADDPYMQRGLIFVSRCQNLKSQFNQLPGASHINDGGFASVLTLENKRANEKNPRREHRSCGSITCAGLNSLIYAGVPKHDVRVQAARKWLGKNYTLAANPGMANPRRGLFFYYYSFVKIMNLLEADLIVDERGIEHDWRKELATVLLQCQRPDGSWVNSDESERTLESDPVQITAYAILALLQLRDGPGAGSFSSVSLQERELRNLP